MAGEAVRSELAALGVSFHLGTVVERIDRKGEGVRFTLANGKTVEADVVLSAVGLRPGTGIASAAGEWGVEKNGSDVKAISQKKYRLSTRSNPPIHAFIIAKYVRLR